MMVYPLFLKCLQPPSCTFTLRLQQVALVVKNLPANAGDIRDAGLILRSGRSPGGGHGNPLQSSCLENPLDRGAWQATVHGTAKRLTRPNRLSMHQALIEQPLVNQTSIYFCASSHTYRYSGAGAGAAGHIGKTKSWLAGPKDEPRGNGQDALTEYVMLSNSEWVNKS